MTHTPNTGRRAYLGPAVLLCSLALMSCTTNNTSGDAGSIPVVSSEKECKVASTSAPAGNIVFSVTNDGSSVTEFYLLGPDRLRVVGEVENIGPGITRSLVVRAAEGSYFTVCKPGMKGDGIQSGFTVTPGSDNAVASGTAELLETATEQYALYVRQQSEALVLRTTEFAELYSTGSDDAARDLYAVARTHWERIEPVAESFGDLDPRLDLREADLEDGQSWTGWHRIEKDLWPQKAGDTYVPASATERKALAGQLVSDTVELDSRVKTLSFDATQLGNGAKELLDEVATGKVTGEEEIWSGTDLWDFQANVDGARIAFEVLEPALREKDSDLADLLESRFTSLQTLLDKYRVGDGFVVYSTLGTTQVTELSRAVDALGEPLSKLTAAVVL